MTSFVSSTRPKIVLRCRKKAVFFWILCLLVSEQKVVSPPYLQCTWKPSRSPWGRECNCLAGRQHRHQLISLLNPILPSKATWENRCDVSSRGRALCNQPWILDRFQEEDKCPISHPHSPARLSTRIRIGSSFDVKELIDGKTRPGWQMQGLWGLRAFSLLFPRPRVS